MQLRDEIRFQSTPSAWRVTDNLNQVFQPFSISIHTLRVEGDSSRSALIAGSKQISIHTLRVEGDNRYFDFPTGKVDFNPHPPRGG